jgi:hypothetical protein
MRRFWHPVRILLLVLWVVASLHWAGVLDRQGRVVAGSAEPPTATLKAVVLAPTPTGEPYPIGDLMFRGHVYKAGTPPGLLQPIVGANVGVTTCQQPRKTTTTAADGSFSLDIPSSYLDECESLIIDVWADGYGRISLALSVAALRAQPNRDFSLGEMAGTLALPLMFR